MDVTECLSFTKKVGVPAEDRGAMWETPKGWRRARAACVGENKRWRAGKGQVVWGHDDDFELDSKGKKSDH